MITSEFHKPRACAIHTWYACFSLREALMRCARFSLHYRLFSLKASPSSSSPGYTVECEGVADPSLADAGLEARRRREQDSLASFRAGPLVGMTDLGAVHAWLFTKHAAYAPGRRSSRGIDESVKGTY
jgi:hypothetical protein